MKSSFNYSTWFTSLTLGFNWPTSSRVSSRVGYKKKQIYLRRGRRVPPKRREISTRLYDVTCQENSNPYSHRRANRKSCTGLFNIFCKVVYLHNIFENAESIWFHMSYFIQYEFCLVRSFLRFPHSPSKCISPFLSCI